MDTMDFARGDANYHTFSLPATSFTPGGRLFFAAKASFDDDNTDSAALVQGNWDDNAVSDITIDGVAYKQWNCTFPPSATNGVKVGASKGKLQKLLGEFQYVLPNTTPQTYPAFNEKKIPVVVYMDVKRKVTV